MYHVIYLHREDYPISVLRRFFEVSRSGYYDFVHRLGRPEWDAELGLLLQEQQARVRQTYGTAGCGCGWSSKVSTGTLRQYYGP